MNPPPASRPEERERAALLVFSKLPVDQEAKTRLRGPQGLDDHSVQEIQAGLVWDTLEVAQRCQLEQVFVYWASEPDIETSERLSGSLPLAIAAVQRGERFPERFQNALNETYKISPKGIVAIGSDCPYLSPAMIRTAAEEVSAGKFVLGPSLRGGYYLIGIPPGSTVKEIAASLRERVESLAVQELYNELPQRLLALLPDLDLPEDLLTFWAWAHLAERSNDLELHFQRTFRSLAKLEVIEDLCGSNRQRIAIVRNT